LQQEFDDHTLENEIEEAMFESLNSSPKNLKDEAAYPKTIHIFPLLRRPFFPGMAAPLMIEPGPFYEVLKQIAKSDHKCIGLLLSKREEGEIHQMGFKDLYRIGILARILRIIPMEKGGAQIILNMEKRFEIIKEIEDPKALKAQVIY